MTLLVHTARVSYDGPDRIDVTRGSATASGLPFSPSWTILRPAKELLHLADQLATIANDAPLLPGMAAMDRAIPAKVSEAIAGNTWALYAAAYLGEMRESYRPERRAWDELLARESVTLVCYCVDPARCHRTLLAEILVKLGATYLGERSRG